MNHEKIWDAVDNLAKANGLSASGLAKKAGLDSTTFNKSKRTRPDGKKRFPSLDSIQKIIESCHISFEEFYNLGKTSSPKSLAHNIPYVELSKLEENAELLEDKTYLKKIKFPDSKDKLYAIEIDCETLIYDIGSILILSQNSETRRKDRILVKYSDGNIFIGEFIRRTARTIEIIELNDKQKEISLEISKIKEINRILWVSQ
ncbi:MAG: hypothetical protein PHE89_05550 [Alphaproteobacteria bacterium]|nr:hypothetical protein [Alphaproteobacteria bacterium]